MTYPICTTPPPDARIRALEANNQLLRTELYAQRNQHRRGFWRGVAATVGAGMLIAALAYSLPAFSEVNITGTIIDMQPAPPPAVAEVTMNNWSANGPQDDGTYPLAMPGLAVEIEFTWNVGQIGEDRITVTPPAGFICDPTDCTATVPEGQSGRVVIFQYVGM